MICTNCHQDDQLDQDFSALPLHAVKLLCEQWLCDECMDEREAVGGLTTRGDAAKGESA